MIPLVFITAGVAFLQAVVPAGVGGAAIDVVSSIGIAAMVNIIIESLNGIISPRAKPPVAVAIGVAIAIVGLLTIDGAYPNALTAVSVGLTAGAAASGIASWRQTYRQEA